MPQIIRTNMFSLHTQRNLDRSQTSLSTALQRLSSGLRINSSKDDAAGLAIAQRMTSQVDGLDASRRNANDGVSLSQTAEAALSTVGEMLRRIRDLAVQSANASNSDMDRIALNEEVVQLQMEIERIGNDTSFNGRKLLDGSFINQYFQIGADAAQISIVSLLDSRSKSIGAQFSAEEKQMVFGAGAPVQNHEYSFDINGVRITARQTSATGDYSDLKNAINRQTNRTNITAEFINPADPTSGLTLSGASFDVGNFWALDNNGNYVSSLPTITPQLVGTLPATPMNNANAGTNGMTQQVLSLFGYLGRENINIADGATAEQIAARVNAISTVTGVEASARTIAYLSELGGDGIVGFQLYGRNSSPISISADASPDNLTGLALAINDNSDVTGISAELSTDKKSIRLVSERGDDIVIEDFNSSNVANPTIVFKGPTAIGNLADSGTASVLLDGANDNADSSRIGGRVFFHSEKGFRVETNDPAIAPGVAGSLLAETRVIPTLISIQDIDVTTRESANITIISVDAALTAINENRARLGAIQNRFEASIGNLQAVSENLSAARSRIRDSDYAAETANLATSQILREAGIAMLAQANAIPNNVLTLLRG